MAIEEKLKNKTVCIIGLGYISSLLAKTFVVENK
jgi:phosphoglycerate dehydrogenase-like enzyme